MWEVRSSYHSEAGPLRFFLVWRPEEKRNLDASWTVTKAVSSASEAVKGTWKRRKREIQTMFLQNMQDVLVARSADWWSYF